MTTRRVFLAGGTLAFVAMEGVRPRPAASRDAGFEVTRSEAEWRRLLTPDQFAVLRQSATEPPFASPLLHEGRKGLFACAGCALGLFDSATKYDSRTGWPSFWAPQEKAVGTSEDTSAGMVRTAAHCNRCGGHLGHVFNDGPKPTGLRHCMNGWAMSFKAANA